MAPCCVWVRRERERGLENLIEYPSRIIMRKHPCKKAQPKKIGLSLRYRAEPFSKPKKKKKVLHISPASPLPTTVCQMPPTGPLGDISFEPLYILS